jgi:D-alanyl-lipoteichoic acid acyltransferase DltB (MBOAT superfamily)
LLFNSIHFLLFFPAVVLLYFALPHKIRWIWLLLASYYFYMSWNPLYALLIATSTVITYFSGLLIDKSNKIEDKKKRVFQCKLWVALSFISNLSILFFFKYFYFAVDNINRIFSYISIQALTPSFDVLLPVGISFYTFQALSYTMDVYRGEFAAERNLAKYALFVSFFPALIAGPIERSKNLLVQVYEKHYFDYNNVKNGLLLMLWGYFQKVIIADRVAIAVNIVYGNYTAYSGFQIALITVLFAIQVYCDFSGYSDIAKGASQVMGFRLMDNFRQPFFAVSVQDFWKRWHISLSTWFRDYVYIPLGGSRHGRWKKYRNIMISFLACGLWHGANWNYLIWGGLHGAYQVIGDATRAFRDKLYAALRINTKAFSFKLGQILITFFLISFSMPIFRASGMTEALHMISKMIFNFELSSVFNTSFYMSVFGKEDLFVAGVSIIILLLANILQSKMNVRDALAKQNLPFRWLCYFSIIMFILAFGVYGTDYAQTQFIYFQF